jgi:hypothetical protein
MPEEIHTKFYPGNPQGKYHLDDLRINEKILSQWILNTFNMAYDCVDWIKVAPAGSICIYVPPILLDFITLIMLGERTNC